MSESSPSPSFEYVAPELRVFQGRNSLVALKRELERNRCSRAVVICGNTVSRSAELAGLRETLGSMLVGTTASAREHSPVPSVEEAARFLAAAGADAIIAIGGGSAAVTARAAAIALGEKKPLAELCTRRLSDGKFESPRLNAPKLPQFVVPTTPSTAFAKAGTAVHSAQGERLALFDPKTRAKGIFVHPDFVRTAPVELAQSAALNAFANAVEAIESPRCDPFSEALLLQAMRLIKGNLRLLDDTDVQVRERLVVSAILCGRGTEQGGTGLASVLAHAIGHRNHVANGIVNAIVLPHTMRYNAPVTASRSAAIIEVMQDRTSSASDTSAPSHIVEEFLRKLPVAKSLREIGMKRDDLAPVADAAMLDWFISRNARVVPNAAALEEVLDAAW